MNGILIPQNIFVGDTAQFLFPLSEQEALALPQQGIDIDRPLPLNELIQNDMMSVKELQLIKRDNGYYLQITFIPWEIGEITFPVFPSLKLKRALPPVHVSSLLETGQSMTLQPPKPPLLLPGTDYLLYGAAITGVGILLLIGTGVWLVFRKLQKSPPRTARKRMRVLKKHLKHLHKEARSIWKQLRTQKAASTMDCPDTLVEPQQAAVQMPQTKTAAEIREWYAAIDRSLREYLSALYAENNTAALNHDTCYFSSATYTELTDILTELFAAEPNISDLFRIFYTMMEKQRFGSDTSTLIKDYTAVSQDILKKIPYIAGKTETAYTIIKQQQKALADTEPALPKT